METVRNNIWQGLLAIPAILLMALAAATEPVEISGTLDPEQQTFGGLAYNVFEVVTDRSAVMAVRSDAQYLEHFAYFRSPQFIQENFSLDWISEDLENLGYQGDVTPEGVVGTWLFFVLAESSQGVTPFETYFDNAISVSEIDPSQIDVFDMVSAFDQFDVSDKEASQRVSVPLLSNMLASSFFRRKLIGEFSFRLFETVQELEDIVQDLEEAERRFIELQRALENSAGLEESQALVVDILEPALKSAQSSIDISAIQGTELLALREGLQRDLVQLREIDALADPNGEEIQFLRQSFATSFLDNDGEVSVRVTGRYGLDAPVLDIFLPTYLPGSGADILEPPVIEAPVIVEEPTSGSGSATAGWNPEDWNGSAFVKQDDIFRATHRVVLNRGLLEQAAAEMLGRDKVETLGDASTILTGVLGDEGFADLSYQGIENDASGFILATGLDQTDANGVPLEGELRNSNEVVKIKDRSLSGYLRALFTSEPGYFRAILFLVSAEQYSNTGPTADFRTMQVWSDKALKGRLPDAVAARSYSDKHEITALIYEFRKVAAPEFIDKTRSSIQARAHFASTQRLKNHLVR